jgi:WD40 repeat protein
MRYSPDGKRLVAGDYPGGVVVIWDVDTGNIVQQIETGHGLRRSFEYFYITPDWQTLFVPQGKTKTERVERDGKHLLRWEYDGAVRAWDVATGKLTRTLRHEPARNYDLMFMSPDGRRFITRDELPGVRERREYAISLWDAASGTSQPLPNDLFAMVCFSPDGESVAATTVNTASRATAVKLFDAANGRVRWATPIKEPDTIVFVNSFSPDGKLLVGTQRPLSPAKELTQPRESFKWWDAATGRELASFDDNSKRGYSACQFSPDGQTLAVVRGHTEQAELLLFRTVDQQLVTRLTLGTAPAESRLGVSQPAYSPDGRWLATIISQNPNQRPPADIDVRDLPQPRILLIDVAAGEVRETLVMPPCYGGTPCFSLDGRTLATSGYGRVLLWDLSRPPGAVE